MLFNSFEFVFRFLPLAVIGFFLVSRFGSRTLAVIGLFLTARFRSRLLAVIGSFLISRSDSRPLAIAYLSAASMFFYAWWSPWYLLLILAEVVFNFLLGRQLARPDLSPAPAAESARSPAGCRRARF